MNSISINNNSIERKIYNNKPVVTFKDIDLVHQRPDGTASRNFKNNRKHFLKNIDYFEISRKDYGTKFVPLSKRGNPQAIIYLFTESGYLMLVKSFTDDLAWQVQRQLVNSYFRLKEEAYEQLELEPYKLEKKTYKGKPVLIVRDLEYLTGQGKNSLNWIIKTNGLGFLLQGRSLDDFKYENNSFYNMKYSLNILFEDDVYSLIKRYDVDSDKLEDVDKYFEADSKEEFNQDVDLYIRLRDLKNLYRSLGLYEINDELRKKITRIISEELIRLGVLDKPRDDFSLGSADVWNMESEIRNLRVSLSKGKDYTKNILELAANHN